MEKLYYNNISEAYIELDKLLDQHENGYTLNKETNLTEVKGEIINANIVIANTYDFGDLPNYNLFIGELAWTLSGSGELSGIRPFSSFWDAVIKQDWTDSSYGYALFSRGIDQVQRVINTLKHDINSRQAVISYLETIRKTPTDIFCTISTQYLSREGRLEAIVTMRSNDIDRGFRYDMAYQLFLLRWIACELGLPNGQMYINIGSLHKYANRRIKNDRSNGLLIS